MENFLSNLDAINCPKKIERLKTNMLSKPRYISIEQARIITDVYNANPGLPAIRRRAAALRSALKKIRIEIDPEELIVGNRACGSKTGIVFPEAGVEWVYREIDTLPSRPQDKFQIRPQDRQEFLEHI